MCPVANDCGQKILTNLEEPGLPTSDLKSARLKTLCYLVLLAIG